MRDAVDHLFETLSIDKVGAPFLPDADAGLKALFERSWGGQWQETMPALQKLQLMSAGDVTTSLISSFLFNDVMHNKGQLHALLPVPGHTKDIVSQLLPIEGNSLARCLLDELH